MKKQLFKAFILVLSLFLITFPLVSCKNAIKGDEAKQVAKDFLACAEADDYEGILEMMHPDKATTAEAIGILLQKSETDDGIDFSAGITDIKFNGFSSAVYDSEYQGAHYELEGRAKAGGVVFEFEIELVRNDAGYGLYDFDFDT